MASKKILVQLDIQAASNLTSPSSGFVGFSAKADGLYQKIGTAPELRFLTSADVQNAILADGSITGAVSQAQIFTMGVKLYNLTQGYIPYASGATKLLSNSPIYTDGTSVGIGTMAPGTNLPNGFTAGKVLEISQGDSTNDAGLLIHGGSTTDRGIELWVDGNTANVYFDSKFIGGNTTLNGSIFFRTQTGGTPVSAMSILQSGNVGIGTPAPNQQLEITKNFRLPSTAGTTPYGIIYKGSTPFIHDFNYGNNGTVTTAGRNTFVGISAGNFTMGSTATQTYHASYNTGIGYTSLISNTTGNSNTANGYSSFYSNTTGSNNTALGYDSGRYIADGTIGRSTGDNGLYLGCNSKASADGTNNEIVIGYNAIGAGSNKTVIGNSLVTDTYFGSSTGSSKLWASALNLSSLTASKVVFTDGSKNLTSTGIGTAAQFIKGDGSLDSNTYLTSSSISGFVPYIGATSNVDLGTHNLSCNEISTASTLTVGNINNSSYTDGGYLIVTAPSGNYAQLSFYSKDTFDSFGVVQIIANPEEGISLRSTSNDYSSDSYLEIRHWELGFYTNLQKRLEIAQSGSINAFGNTITSTGGFIGNASTATKLQTARTITIGGQSLSFDGTANLTYSLSGIGIPVGTASQYFRGDLSLATFPTIHTGSGVDGRITFWNGTNSLSSNANLTWDNTNSRLTVYSIYSAYSFKLGTSTTAGYVLTTDANGNGTWQAPPTGVTIGAIGSVPNANGMSISGQALSLQPASALYGGVLTNSAQTIAGAKTLSSLLTASAGIANNGSYTQTGTSLNTFTGTSTFSNATYSALFTGGNVGIGTPAPNQQLEITQNFRLPSTAGTTPYGIIYKGADRFIHDFNYGNNGTVTTAGRNTFVGISAGNLTMGSTATQTYFASYNTGIGYQSLSSNTTGCQNTANGYASFYFNTTGNSNTASGYASLYSNTTGSNNTALGYNSGRYLADGTTGRSTGENGLYLGYNSKASADGTNNEIVIGYNAIGAGSNKTVIGNSLVTDTYFGSSTGSSKLWASALNLSGLTASKVVFTNASKNLTSTGIGTASQFIKGDGSLDSNTYITSSGFVPYTGANDNVDIGSYVMYANNFILNSDARLKCNIEIIKSKNIDIDYKKYEFKSAIGDIRYGVIAQDLLKVAPELVLGSEKEGYSVKYIDLLIHEIAYLKNEINKLKQN